MTTDSGTVEVEVEVHDRLTFLVLAVGVGAYSLLQSSVIPVMSTIEHDLHASPAKGSWILTVYLSAPLVARFGSKPVIVVGLLVAAVSFGGLAVRHGQIWEVCVLVGLYGVGFGLAFAATASLIVDAVEPSQTGVASGMNANILTVGGAIGSALATSVVIASLLPGGIPAAGGYVHAFYLMAGGCVLAAAAGLLIPRLRHDDAADVDDPPHLALASVAAGTVVGDKPSESSRLRQAGVSRAGQRNSDWASTVR